MGIHTLLDQHGYFKMTDKVLNSQVIFKSLDFNCVEDKYAMHTKGEQAAFLANLRCFEARTRTVSNLLSTTRKLSHLQRCRAKRLTNYGDVNFEGSSQSTTNNRQSSWQWRIASQYNALVLLTVKSRNELLPLRCSKHLYWAPSSDCNYCNSSASCSSRKKRQLG